MEEEKIIEEDRLAGLFAGYNPVLSSDEIFMARLERNLHTVEMVRAQVDNMKRKSRLAVMVAAVTGFLMGILSVICYPYVVDFVAGMAPAGTIAARVMVEYGNLAACMALACVVGGLVYVAYDITLIASGRSLQTIRVKA